jgi:hypothetical protein
MDLLGSASQQREEWRFELVGWGSKAANVTKGVWGWRSRFEPETKEKGEMEPHCRWRQPDTAIGNG